MIGVFVATKQDTMVDAETGHVLNAELNSLNIIHVLLLYLKVAAIVVHAKRNINASDQEVRYENIKNLESVLRLHVVVLEFFRHITVNLIDLQNGVVGFGNVVLGQFSVMVCMTPETEVINLLTKLPLIQSFDR